MSGEDGGEGSTGEEGTGEVGEEDCGAECGGEKSGRLVYTAEQVSHHPPSKSISNINMNNYIISSFITMSTKMF